MALSRKKSGVYLRFRLLVVAIIVVCGIPFITQYRQPESEVTLETFSKRAIPKEALTIVTAYFDIGSFKKGPDMTFSPDTYLNWVKTFKYLNNSLVVYTDSATFRDNFIQLRKGMELKTKIVLVNRTHFWTFRIEDKIKKIFSMKGYPKHYPNTVLSEYSCAQHTKYAVVADAIRNKYFNSQYYAWLDIGYYRDLMDSERYFTLYALDDIDESKLSVNLVYPKVSLRTDYKTIVYNNIVWVGGGMFIGTADVIKAFEKQYKQAVMFLLEKQLISTDQQVIMSMYSQQGRRDLNVTVPLQLHSRTKDDVKLKNANPWFYLGYKSLIFT
ncbi:protein HtrL-like isoform X2 [Argopecten irradians]|uniref:protein HtrL-like isoform X2 n=1 Tax=Argopecten irradians TaxID=31199 RepID=UPI003723BC42